MRIKYIAPLPLLVLGLALTGCTNTEGPASNSTDTSSISPDQKAVALLPEAVRDADSIVLGTDAAYPPNAYKDSDGNPTGWEVDLADAVAAKLGKTPEWEILGFDSILPRIQESTVDVGVASFSSTPERQKSVDFVTYLKAGTQWAAAAGEDVDPENACGLTVAVNQGTIQYTEELPAKSKACTDAGKPAIEILAFPGQPEATNAVIDGRADAFTADLAVTGDAVKQLDGKLDLVGDVATTSPYGFPVRKDSGMAEAVQAAVQSLIADGTYGRILDSAGISVGAVDEAVINPPAA